MDTKNKVLNQYKKLNTQEKTVSDINNDSDDTYVVSYHCHYGTIFSRLEKPQD